MLCIKLPAFLLLLLETWPICGNVIV